MAAIVLCITGYGCHKLSAPIARALLRDQLELTNTTIHYRPVDAGVAREIARGFAVDRDRINSDLRTAPARRTDIWLTTSPYIYNLLCGNPLPFKPGGMHEADGGASDGGVLALCPPDWTASANRGPLREPGPYIIAHEYVHVVVHTINPRAVQVQWLNEGLAMYEAGGDNQVLRGIQRAELAELLRTGKLPSLSQIGDIPFGQFVQLHGYTLGCTAVNYIVRTYGMDGLTRLIRSAGDPVSALGVNEDQLTKGWQGFLLTEYFR
jgi:hypothetical protein